MLYHYILKGTSINCSARPDLVYVRQQHNQYNFKTHRCTIEQAYTRLLNDQVK